MDKINIGPVQFIEKVIRRDEKGQPFRPVAYQRRVLKMALRRDPSGRRNLLIEKWLISTLILRAVDPYLALDLSLLFLYGRGGKDRSKMTFQFVLQVLQQLYETWTYWIDVLLF